MTRKAARATLILGIHREELGRELRQRAACRGRAAGSVLVEIEAKLAGTVFARRFVGATIQNGLACWELWLHRRVRAALRCASGPYGFCQKFSGIGDIPKAVGKSQPESTGDIRKRGRRRGRGEASATTALASRSQGI